MCLHLYVYCILRKRGCDGLNNFIGKVLKRGNEVEDDAIIFYKKIAYSCSKEVF